MKNTNPDNTTALPRAQADTLLARIVATLNRTTLPALYESGVVNFQMTRGAKGISL